MSEDQKPDDSSAKSAAKPADKAEVFGHLKANEPQKIYILKGNQTALVGAENYLRKRGWKVETSTNLKLALIQIIQMRPDFVFISADNPHPKAKIIPKVLVQVFPCFVIGFAEAATRTSANNLERMGTQYTLVPPISGPKIERMVNKIIIELNSKPPEQRLKMAQGSGGGEGNTIAVRGGQVSDDGGPSAGSAADQARAAIQAMLSGGDEDASESVSSGRVQGDSSGIGMMGSNQNSSSVESSNPSAGFGQGSERESSMGMMKGEATRNRPAYTGQALGSENGSAMGAGSFGFNPDGSPGGQTQGQNQGSGFGGFQQGQNQGSGFGGFQQGQNHGSGFGGFQQGQNQGSGFGRSDLNHANSENAQQDLENAADKLGMKTPLGRKSTAGLNSFNDLPESPGETKYWDEIKKKANEKKGNKANPSAQDFADAFDEIGQGRAPLKARKRGDESREQHGNRIQDFVQQREKSVQRRPAAREGKDIIISGDSVEPESFKSMMDEGTYRTLKETVVIEGGENNFEFKKLEKSSNIACIVVESPKFSGYLVAAMGSDRKIDKEFIETVRSKLKNFLKEKGEEITEKETLDLTLQEVEFTDWALQQAEFLRKSVHKGDEIAMAFFPADTAQKELQQSKKEHMLMIEMEELKPDTAVEFDLYVYLPENDKYILYTPKGKKLAGAQKSRLTDKGVSQMHLRKESSSDVKRYRVQNFLNDKIASYKTRKQVSP